MSTRIFYAGDSTVQYNDIHTYPQTGLGQVIGLFFTQETEVLNYGRNGRSTKSFIAEGRLQAIDRRIRKDDILLIQFGHNDEKDDPARGTKAFGDFQENLLQFIQTARRHEALPVLITPLYRRHFDEHGNIKDAVHLDYPEAMLALAEREGVPCIDLCRKSKQLLQEVGEETSKMFYMNFPAGVYHNYPEGKEDNTHLRYEGAIRFASLIIEELYHLGGPYRQSILTESRFDETEFKTVKFNEKDVD